MSKPMIGVTCGDRLLFQTENFEGERASYTLAGITNAIHESGGLPVILPIHDEALSREYIDKIDGLCLTGGADISPQFYDQQPMPKLQRVDPRRDLREIELVKAAIARKMPMLGICRGFQLINVCMGGDLYQDLDYHPGITVQHNQLANSYIPVHRIKVKPKSHFSTLVPDQIMINSYHHQTINDLAEDLEAVAWSDDGVIEAFEAVNEDYDIVGVQYHPEGLCDVDPTHMNVFKDFIGRVDESRESVY